jgi:hypothetical protein
MSERSPERGNQEGLTKCDHLTSTNLFADNGSAERQICYDIAMWNGENGSIDLRSAAYYFELSADQGNADGQCVYSQCLRDGTGISTDLRSDLHYLNSQPIKTCCWSMLLWPLFSRWCGNFREI